MAITFRTERVKEKLKELEALLSVNTSQKVLEIAVNRLYDIETKKKELADLGVKP
jgi:hypothetical protein